MLCLIHTCPPISNPPVGEGSVKRLLPCPPAVSLEKKIQKEYKKVKLDLIASPSRSDSGKSLSREEQLSYQTAFQTAALARIGKEVQPLGSSSETLFLRRISVLCQEKGQLECMALSVIVSQLGDNAIKMGVNNTQALCSVTKTQPREMIAILKPALENFFDGLKTPWDRQQQQRDGISYSEMLRNERLSSVLAGVYQEALGLDFAVPETHLVRVSAKEFGEELRNKNLIQSDFSLLCSLHEFIPDTTNLAAKPVTFLETIPPKEITKIALLDILLYNTDRGRRNVLVKERDRILVPIDHSLVASKRFQDNAKFFWLGLNAVNQPNPADLVERIRALDWGRIKRAIEEDCPSIDDETLNTLNTAFLFLKTGSSLGLTLYEIGSLMYRKGGLFDQGARHLAQHYYEEASSETGDFSENVKKTVEYYLKLCVGVLRDPKYESWTRIPQDVNGGFRTPLLNAIMAALNNTILYNAPFNQFLDEGLREMKHPGVVL